ncbi:WavE lipopolysaccharide synthesis family protein [Vibrio ostreicida]|uniref:WavE lipopolysaccharide synthesis family protein n=1 Tax=Vibrio ostreicida TaxID=526588 RepID=UPI0009710BE2|nr:WavE lipopolysaccharide synthesis family protein [Vibrio ostreicida]
MNFEDITFVIQGPIMPSVTQRSIDTIRNTFPKSHVIVSTWEGADTSQLTADETILSQDPGSTVFVYSKKDQAIPVNINRQIVSTLAGLLKVKTKYAVKLRADNVLHKTTVIDLFEQYQDRETQYAFLNHRLICSNYFAKEYERGLKVPYFYSDFFQFGETEDLITVWRQPHYEDYSFNTALAGKKQHADYPNDSVNVEQKIWSHFANQFLPARLTDEHASKYDRENSHKVMINNLVIVDGDVLGLEVPKRLRQHNGYPFHFYTYHRWQWLYEKEFHVDLKVPIGFKLAWTIATFVKTIQKGLRIKIKKQARKSMLSLKVTKTSD